MKLQLNGWLNWFRTFFSPNRSNRHRYIELGGYWWCKKCDHWSFHASKPDPTEKVFDYQTGAFLQCNEMSELNIVREVHAS
jgi:hypothetical protein